MSIPRFAIHRPVTMFMISAVVTLLGFISLTRLPVDLMPEFEQPTLTVRTTYAGVGPLEMEELITRPMEQAVSAVPGLTRVESSSSEGNSQVRLNFEWGSDLSEAADEIRTVIAGARDAGTQRLALSNISFELEAGQALAVIGPSAAGKSSLARAIVGKSSPPLARAFTSKTNRAWAPPLPAPGG